MSVVVPTSSYIALSYVWGNEEADKEIFIDGKPFKIRPNLFDFLNFRRKKMAKAQPALRPVFIDALCINQSNIAERIIRSDKWAIFIGSHVV